MRREHVKTTFFFFFLLRTPHSLPYSIPVLLRIALVLALARDGGAAQIARARRSP
jgi:hypothetical protein